MGGESFYSTLSYTSHSSMWYGNRLGIMQSMGVELIDIMPEHNTKPLIKVGNDSHPGVKVIMHLQVPCSCGCSGQVSTEPLLLAMPSTEL